MQKDRSRSYNCLLYPLVHSKWNRVRTITYDNRIVFADRWIRRVAKMPTDRGSAQARTRRVESIQRQLGPA
jgi:hypothetical protein